jgi:hypothetical protein
VRIARDEITVPVQSEPELELGAGTKMATTDGSPLSASPPMIDISTSASSV